MPMPFSSRAPATSSSLRLEVLPDDPNSPSTSTNPHPTPISQRTLPINTSSGSSSLSAPSSKLRHVTSHSTFTAPSSAGGRSRSGSITSPRPANLSLLVPPSPSLQASVVSSSSTSSAASSPVGSVRRPRSGSAAPAISKALFDQTDGRINEANSDSDLIEAQLNLTLDKGPPTSIDTWEPVIPDIMVHDEDAGRISHGDQLIHDEEEEKIVSAYQVLNLIIPDISEAAAAAEAAEQLELEQQQQLLQQHDNDLDHIPQMVSQSSSSSSVAIEQNNSAGSSTSNNPNEKTMSEYLRSNLANATDYLAVSTMGIGTGLIPPSASGASTRPGTPITGFTLHPASSNSPSSSMPNVSSASLAQPPHAGTAIHPSSASLASRFRLPFSSRAFIPPSRPQSVHQHPETPYRGSEGLLGINNPMQMSTTQLNNGSGIRSSFFDYRLANLLQFGASSIAPSIRSFDPTRINAEDGESRQEFYEVEFNLPPDPVAEESRRMDHTIFGRVRKVLRSGFPGRDLDPKTRKPRYKYPTNNIKTTKYTMLTFLPVNLLFQFKRFYNLYFLAAAVFVCAEPSLSPVTQILPLTLVLTITAIKDALEDYRRYQQDKRSNSLPCTLVENGVLIPIKSKDVRPGDVLKICKNDKIPADVVLLSTSMDEGACFVETSELDGETNLKRKAALSLTSQLTRVEQVSEVTGKITTEMPNERLSRLDGRVKIKYEGTDFSFETLDDHLHERGASLLEEKTKVIGQDDSKISGNSSDLSDNSNSLNSRMDRDNSKKSGGRINIDEMAPVTMTNVALRGSWLKNTEWVYGVVLYAGVDTKMMRNLKNTGLKFSTMETKLNRMIVAIFVFNAFLLVGSMCFAYIGSHSATLRAPAAWYTTVDAPEFTPPSSSARIFVGQLMNFFVVYTFVIPISVFISVELCRVVQALWMIWDEEMRSYNEGPLSQAEQEEIALEQGTAAAGEKAAVIPIKRRNTSPRSGSESTQGTSLTRTSSRAPKKPSFWRRAGKLGFLKKKKKPAKNWTRMHVRNSNLNEDLGAVEYIFSDKTGTLTRNVMKLSKWHIGGRTFHELQQPGSLGLRMRDPSISDEEYDLLMAFCRNIAVCHAVLPCEDSKTGELLYEAQSPDESALLEALRDNGVVLKAKTKDSVTVEIFGLITETYTVLKVLEFTSDRKCMSVIIDTPQGIQLFCKGADNVILARADVVENDPLLMRQLDSTVRRFSIAGLRTLMLAWRPLSPEEYRIFDENYSKAECHVGDGEDGSGDREDLIRVACETIEGRLRLLGCTAIEDRLQDQVPETIEYLMEADIKIWLLTGDKQETAINIGISSRLISPAMKILVLNVKVERDCRLVLEYFVDRIKERELRDEERYLQEYQQHSGKAGFEPPEKDRYALVVNGESLAFVLGNEIFEEMFLKIGTSCHSVICCRVTPLQKALVVKLVRKKLHKVTLAIGDGANDISMIQAAHVGVGIEGMEGAQAARSSDFSFKQFKNLKRLLTIHGRYSYLRMSKIIFFSFYKSICLITVQFWFGFTNAWSGGALYNEHFLTLWNMVFTALLPITTACFEKDVDEDMIGKYPKLYKAVKDGFYWNTLTMAGWGIASFWHSGALFGGIYGALSHEIVGSASESMDVSMVSFFAGSVVLITVTLKMLLMITHYTMPIYLALGISMAGYMLVFIGLEVVGLLESGVFSTLHSLPLYYLGLLVIPVGCLLPDYVIAYSMRQFMPSDANIIQEDQRLTKMKIAAGGGGVGGRGSGSKKNILGDLEDQDIMVEMQDSPRAQRVGVKGARHGNDTEGEDVDDDEYDEDEDDDDEEECDDEEEEEECQYESVGRGVYDEKRKKGKEGRSVV
ncbi:hypothetical protein BG004_002265 [Podila humilis]|nr:hypothetical protein BG004_002265 [Podila humilis]